MGSGASKNSLKGMESIRNAVKIVEEKQVDHPEADDLQTLQVAQQEVRSLRALVLQMGEVIKAQHDKVMGLHVVRVWLRSRLMAWSLSFL